VEQHLASYGTGDTLCVQIARHVLLHKEKNGMLSEDVCMCRHTGRTNQCVQDNKAVSQQQTNQPHQRPTATQLANSAIYSIHSNR